MKTVDRQKMCAHCDGRLPLDADRCIHCGAEVKTEPASAKSSVLFANQSLQDSLASLYTPPYSVKSPHFSPATEKKKVSIEQMTAPVSPSKTSSEAPFESVPRFSSAPTAEPTRAAPSPDGVPEVQGSLVPLVSLLVAAQIFTLGILQLLFSDDGVLRLEWNSSYWFLYCLSAVPLFFFGLKKAGKLR